MTICYIPHLLIIIIQLNLFFFCTFLTTRSNSFELTDRNRFKFFSSLAAANNLKLNDNSTEEHTIKIPNFIIFGIVLAACGVMIWQNYCFGRRRGKKTPGKFDDLWEK